MSILARKVDSILANKLGFSRRGRKHRIYTLQIEGREVARTLISHGTKEISDRIHWLLWPGRWASPLLN